MNSQVISKKVLQGGKLIYSYCPYCVKNMRENHVKDEVILTNLEPVMFVTTKDPVKDADAPNGIKWIYDSHYECKRCGKKDMQSNDWEQVYCDKPRNVLNT